jgi:2-iminobutanoate/2-iminopropanoate deaminase
MILGRGPLDSNGIVVAGTIEEETTRAVESIHLLLEHAGARLDQIVKCCCFLADIDDLDGFDRAYGRFFGDHLPRTLVECSSWQVGRR